jgi:hypothetical protein
MNTLSSDTHPEIERLHIELIRKSPISRRLQMVSSLVKTTRQLSWQGICKRYPHDTKEARIERKIFYAIVSTKELKSFNVKSRYKNLS